jgi:phosphoglycolate phosphatase-like HAD superfamily hydrolase
VTEPTGRAVLFDIDGTLISTGGASDRAWGRAIRELYGVDFDVGAHTGRGVPDPEVGRQVLEQILEREPTVPELAAAMQLRLRYLPEEVEASPGYRVEPGVVELLDALGAEGVLLGLTTGNVEGAAHVKLARANLNHYFTFGGYGSDAADRTELTRTAVARAKRIAGDGMPDSAIIAVGDTPRDVEAGHGAGIRVVGVASGEYGVEELREAGADWAIASLEEGLPL